MRLIGVAVCLLLGSLLRIWAAVRMGERGNHSGMRRNRIFLCLQSIYAKILFKTWGYCNQTDTSKSFFWWHVTRNHVQSRLTVCSKIFACHYFPFYSLTIMGRLRNFLPELKNYWSLKCHIAAELSHVQE